MRENSYSGKVLKVVLTVALVLGMTTISQMPNVKEASATSEVTTSVLESVVQDTTKISIVKETNATTSTEETYMLFEPNEEGATSSEISALGTSSAAYWGLSNRTSIQSIRQKEGTKVVFSGSATYTNALSQVYAMFMGCTNLTDISGLKDWDTSGLTRMTSMFRNCSSLTSVEALANWKTDSVTEMNTLFDSCTALKSAAGLENWNTANVTNINSMFYDCGELADISALSKWNVEKVSDMGYLFYYNTKLSDISALSDWKTNSVTNLGKTFFGCTSLTDATPLGNWSIARSIYLGSTFYGCTSMSKVAALGNWDTSQAYYMSEMFRYCYSIRDYSFLSNWSFKSASSASNMFTLPSERNRTVVKTFGVPKDRSKFFDDIKDSRLNPEFYGESYKYVTIDGTQATFAEVSSQYETYAGKTLTIINTTPTKGTTGEDGKVTVQNPADMFNYTVEVDISDVATKDVMVEFVESGALEVTPPEGDQYKKIKVTVMTTATTPAGKDDLSVSILDSTGTVASGTTKDGGVYEKAVSTFKVAKIATNATITGDDSATYGVDYTATVAAAEHYNLPASVSVKIGETELTDVAYNAETGELTIPGASVTGNITITATGVAKSFTVTKTATNATITGDDSATYGVDYTAAVTAAEHYNLPASVSVKIGETELSEFEYSRETGAIKIAGASITGNITITAAGVAKSFIVTKTATNATITGDDSATYGVDYTATVAAAEHYNLPASVSVKIGETELTDVAYNAETGELTIPGASVTGNITITAAGVAKSFIVTKTATNATITGDDSATYGVDYTATVVANEGYNLPENIEVKVGGTPVNGFTYDKETGSIAITGTSIVGTIEILATAILDLPTTVETSADGKAELRDPSTNKKVEFEIEIGSAGKKVSVEITDEGVVKIVVDDSDAEKEISVALKDEAGAAIPTKQIQITNPSGATLFSGTTNSDGAYVKEASVNTTISGVEGTFTVNDTAVKDGDKLLLTSGQDVTVSFKPVQVGDSIKFPTISLNGTVIFSFANLTKTGWLTDNILYNQKMGEAGNKMVGFDEVLNTPQTFTLRATDNNAITVTYTELVVVYRLYNSITSEHLFTTDKVEYDGWVTKCQNNEDYWIGEGIDWFAPNESLTTVTRLYNPDLGAMGSTSHYYTTNPDEIAELTGKYGWIDESTQGQCFFSGGDVPIYTCYNEALGSAHHYTSSSTEWQGLEQYGWALERDKNGNSGVFQAYLGARV